MGDTLYATCGELSLAYQVFGDGPIELVIVRPFATHVELFWTQPEFKAFFDQLATFCRVLLFDKAGVGLSDPVPRVRTLDERPTEIEAVMDAAGFSQAALLGTSQRASSAMPTPVTSSFPAPSVTWLSARAQDSRTAAASSWAVCQGLGSCLRSNVTARERDRRRHNWRRCLPPAPGLQCAARTAPSGSWPDGPPWLLRTMARFAAANASTDARGS